MQERLGGGVSVLPSCSVFFRSFLVFFFLLPPRGLFIPASLRFVAICIGFFFFHLLSLICLTIATLVPCKGDLRRTRLWVVNNLWYRAVHTVYLPPSLGLPLWLCEIVVWLVGFCEVSSVDHIGRCLRFSLLFTMFCLLIFLPFCLLSLFHFFILVCFVALERHK